ncbi:MAG: hypothetical protein U0835_23535 [Isosphaeraceae bacterium]
MFKRSRRGFMADVGRGMIVAGVGLSAAADLGLAPAWARDAGADPLQFGGMEPLVALMQEHSADALLPLLVEKLNNGTELKTLVTAASLANARTFGGEDYVGFHTLMAMSPALHMASELAGPRRALPVLKVLHRNTRRIQEHGGRGSEVLGTVKPADVQGADALRQAVHDKDVARAEAVFAATAKGATPSALLDVLLPTVGDNTEVHRVVLPYRAYDLLGLIGPEQAHTLLRQSVRYCVKSERDWKHSAETDEPRRVLPRLLAEHHLESGGTGHRNADDAWIDQFSKTLFESTQTQAAEAVALALKEGFKAEAIGEAISLAANQLVLRDAGRPANQTSEGKPVGSVHGDSIGVHACDSANAWRNMALVADPRNTAACLILAGYQLALDRVQRGGDFLHWTPHPHAEVLESVKTRKPDALLSEADEAVRAGDQARAAAVVHLYGTLGQSERPVFDLLLKYAISEDGALHAEKYYRTVREEFAATRPAFRWRQLTALARVTASEYGRPAPGYAEACRLLKI